VRSGLVAVVGRPNVGKSTLVNALVGHKVAIISARPQTTRNLIRGVVEVAEPLAQLVLVDTPGLHKPQTKLGTRLNRLVAGTLSEVDAVCFVVDATQPIGRGDQLIAERLGQGPAPVVVALNKVDAARRPQVVSQLTAAGGWEFRSYFPISARTGDGLEALASELAGLLPEGHPLFPPGMHSDQPEAVVVSEILRERFLEHLFQELPHSLAVVTGEIEAGSAGRVRVQADVVVERESQKGMVIGKAGSLLRQVKSEARRELEAVFGAPVELMLRVRVEPDWQERSQLLDRLGF